MKKRLALAGLLLLLQGCLAFGDENVSETSVTRNSSFDWLWGSAPPPPVVAEPQQTAPAPDAGSAQANFPYATTIGAVERHPFARPESNASAQVFPWIGDVPDASSVNGGQQARAATVEALMADNAAARRADSQVRQDSGILAPVRPEHVANIYFAENSAALSPRDAEIIIQVADRLQRTAGAGNFPLNGRAVLRVVGHAAPSEGSGQQGGDLSAFRISLDRARRVADELVARGIPQDALRVEAQGAATPLVTGAAPEMLGSPAYRRRTEIYIIQR